MTNFTFSRRRFLHTVGAASLGTLATPAFPYIRSQNQAKKLGVALVGLGYYSTDVLAPALQLTERCELRGIVTGSPEKVSVWQEKYGIADKNVYDYSNMDQVANNDDIDVIYIVLPPSMHEEYVIRAAKTGKHVWCEKPMAMTEAECQAMIDACESNKVKLSIGYRMHHEPNTQLIKKLAREKPFGKIQKLRVEAAYYDNRSHHWKQHKAMGGGAMYDMGVYPLNAARYTTGEEPIAVTARHETNRPGIYSEVDETTYFTLEFPSGTVAECTTSFGMRMNHLFAACEKGWYELKPFSSYRNVKGSASDGRIFAPSPGNQQARQMDDDSWAILEDQPVLVPGMEGLLDIRVVEAIYRSAAAKERVVI